MGASLKFELREGVTEGQTGEHKISWKTNDRGGNRMGEKIDQKGKGARLHNQDNYVKACEAPGMQTALLVLHRTRPRRILDHT